MGGGARAGAKPAARRPLPPSDYSIEAVRADPDRISLLATVVAASLCFLRQQETRRDRRAAEAHAAAVAAAAAARGDDEEEIPTHPDGGAQYPFGDSSSCFHPLTISVSVPPSPTPSPSGLAPSREGHPSPSPMSRMNRESPGGVSGSQGRSPNSALHSPVARDILVHWFERAEPLRQMAHAARVVALCASYEHHRRVHRRRARQLLRDRMVITAILRENASKGAQRLADAAVRERVSAVERKLDAVRPVLDRLTAKIDPALALDEWGGAECAQLLRNMHLPAYAPAFERNLTGAKLASLEIYHLPQLGVHPFEDQKTVLQAIKELQRALAAQVEEQSVRSSWESLSMVRETALRSIMSGRAKARANSPAHAHAAEATAPSAKASPRGGGGVGLWPDGFGRAILQQRAMAKQHANESLHADSMARAKRCADGGTTISIREIREGSHTPRPPDELSPPTLRPAAIETAETALAPAPAAIVLDDALALAPATTRPMSARYPAPSAAVGAPDARRPRPTSALDGHSWRARPVSARPTLHTSTRATARPKSAAAGGATAVGSGAEAAASVRLIEWYGLSPRGMDPNLRPHSNNAEPARFGTMVSVRRLQPRTTIELMIARRARPSAPAPSDAPAPSNAPAAVKPRPPGPRAPSPPKTRAVLRPTQVGAVRSVRKGTVGAAVSEAANWEVVGAVVGGR